MARLSRNNAVILVLNREVQILELCFRALLSVCCLNVMFVKRLTRHQPGVRGSFVVEGRPNLEERRKLPLLGIALAVVVRG